MALSKQETDFCALVYDFYRKNRRDFIWRQRTDPYIIHVSELMLQQTQTSRVAERLPAFLNSFPSYSELAKADKAALINAWQGLGYNRRALYLYESAKILVNRFDSRLPLDTEELENLPGIGKNTARSILVYAFNQPHAFIETNIRTVFIHHFFNNLERAILDAEILGFVERTMDRNNPREWFWALMDYGVHLKRTVGNLSRKSKTWTSQSGFSGSDREIRGSIIRTLSQKYKQNQICSEVELKHGLPDPKDLRYDKILASLINEGLVAEEFVPSLGTKCYRLAN